jgi:hypothetical protein
MLDLNKVTMEDMTRIESATKCDTIKNPVVSLHTNSMQIMGGGYFFANILKSGSVEINGTVPATTMVAIGDLIAKLSA